jgi:hypothetical protein
MNKFMVIILAGILIGGGIGGWRLAVSINSNKAQHIAASPLPDTGLTQESAPAGEEIIESSPQLSNTMSPAKRIRHGTAVDQDLANAKIKSPGSANENSDKLTRNINSALDGDIDKLIDLTRLINECSRGFSSEEQLQRRLDMMAQRSAQPGGAPFPQGGRGGGRSSVEYKSFEEMELGMWTQFEACQESKEVLDESLHEQIERLADSGLPTARYLYAIWAPDQDPLEPVNALDMLEYQSLALEYTWKNMNERDPLGLLAMSQSYDSVRSPMFTPGNRVLGQVFLLASMKCGIDNKWLEKRSVNFGQGVSRFQGQNMAMPTLEEDAIALAEMFCPLEPSED